MSKAQQQVGPASEFERSRRQVLGEVLARTARRYPDKLALVFGDERRSFAELDQRVEPARQWPPRTRCRDGATRSPS